MPWLRIDDGEADAPWVMQVGNEAYGVYCRLGGYCAKHLTDGMVPAPMAQMIAGGKKPLLALEVVGRITRDEMGTVRLPFYLDSNPSRAQIESDRETRKDKAQKGARARWAQSNGSAR